MDFCTHIYPIGCVLETEEVCFSGTMELPAQHGHCFSFSSVTAVLLTNTIIFYLNRFEGFCGVDLFGIESQSCRVADQ